MQTQSTKILVIDDTASLRDLLKAYLRRLGYLQVDEAEDGEVGLNAMWGAQNLGQPYDVVICDWNMPKMSGLELLQRVRLVPVWKTLPFILLTTESEKAKVVEALQADVTNYMLKPVEEATLRDKIEKALERRRG